MGGNLNIISQWGEPQKRGEPNFEISVGRGGAKGGAKGGGTIFDSDLVGGKITYINFPPKSPLLGQMGNFGPIVG